MMLCDISYADSYFYDRYGADGWWDESELNKRRLLNTATLIINNLNFTGDKSDPDQEDEFPRGTDTEVPVQIKRACCEIALCIMNGSEPNYDFDTLFDASTNLDIGRLTTDPNQVNIAKVHGVPSIVAWGMLRPFLRDGSVITLSRVD